MLIIINCLLKSTFNLLRTCCTLHISLLLLSKIWQCVCVDVDNVKPTIHHHLVPQDRNLKIHQYFLVYTTLLPKLFVLPKLSHYLKHLSMKTNFLVLMENTTIFLSLLRQQNTKSKVLMIIILFQVSIIVLDYGR